MDRARLVLEEIEHERGRYLVIGYDSPKLSCLVTLSCCELEVISQWIEGHSMNTIATTRGCSVRTISNQINSAYRKLGVSSRNDLLALVLKRSN